MDRLGWDGTWMEEYSWICMLGWEGTRMERVLLGGLQKFRSLRRLGPRRQGTERHGYSFVASVPCLRGY